MPNPHALPHPLPLPMPDTRAARSTILRALRGGPPPEPRTLSLVPPVHVAVLKASTLYAGLPAALLTLAPQRDMPTNLVLITGPAKTSDIQQTLAFGAHGPKVLVIVLVNDLPAAGAPA